MAVSIDVLDEDTILELNYIRMGLQLIQMMNDFTSNECFICNRLTCICSDTDTCSSTMSSDTETLSNSYCTGMEEHPFYITAPHPSELPTPQWYSCDHQLLYDSLSNENVERKQSLDQGQVNESTRQASAVYENDDAWSRVSRNGLPHKTRKCLPQMFLWPTSAWKGWVCRCYGSIEWPSDEEYQEQPEIPQRDSVAEFFESYLVGRHDPESRFNGMAD